MSSEVASTLGAADVVSTDQNVIVVELTLTESTPNLGIHVANSPSGELLIDSIIEGSLVCLDGRICVGDELLRINETPLQHLSSLEATQVMRSITTTTKEVTLLINKRSQSPYGKFIRPCDPEAWVAHTEAALQEATWENDFARIPFATAPTMNFRTPATEEGCRLPEVDYKSFDGYLVRIVRDMVRPDSGLGIKDRKWLAHRFKNAVVGSEIVDWLQRYGPFERKYAKVLAEAMFKGGLIRNPMIKHSFNKRSIYTFSEDIELLYQTRVEHEKESETGGTI